MAVKDKVGNTWRDVKAMYDKVGGQWRPVVREWVKAGGVWRQTFINPRGVYFQEWPENVGNLIGSYSITEEANALHASVSGYTGGENKGCAVGWQVKNLPAGAEVEIDYTWYKGAYPMNDVVAYNENGYLAVHSTAGYSYSNTLKTSNHSGWILLVCNFFPTSEYATNAWLKITRLAINGQQVWPAVT